MGSGMLLMTLTLLLAQVPTPPQVLVPGTRYDAALVEPIRGHEAIELCDGIATATVVELRGRRLDPERTVASSGCGSPLLLVGTQPEPGERVTPADRTTDRRTGEVLLKLEGGEYRLRSTPYSDGGLRIALIYPDGFTQPIFESAAAASSFELLWAGDLNGDALPDLVIEASEGLTTFHQLLLSGEDGVTRLESETVTAMR